MAAPFNSDNTNILPKPRREGLALWTGWFHPHRRQWHDSPEPSPTLVGTLTRLVDFAAGSLPEPKHQPPFPSKTKSAAATAMPPSLSGAQYSIATPAAVCIARRCLLASALYALVLSVSHTVTLFGVLQSLQTLTESSQAVGDPKVFADPFPVCIRFAQEAATILSLLVAIFAIHRRTWSPSSITLSLIAFALLRDPVVHAVDTLHATVRQLDPQLHSSWHGAASLSTSQLLVGCAIRSWEGLGLAFQHGWENPPILPDAFEFLRRILASAVSPTSLAQATLNVPALLVLYCILRGAENDASALPQISCTESSTSAASSRDSTTPEPRICSKQFQPPQQQTPPRDSAVGQREPRLSSNNIESPLASRTSLWAAVATSQESNAWRDGTYYFGKELTNSVHAAKRAIDHAHVHPVMHEHYMHFVTFISALDTAIDNIEHIAWQLEHFESADGLAKNDSTLVKRLISRVLFDPVDLNERVGDAIANMADEKGLELIVNSSVQRGKTPEVFLVVGDEDYVRQILLQMLYPIVAKAPEYTRVEINLDLPPPWVAKEDPDHVALGEPRKFHMDVTWQLIYQQDVSLKYKPFFINDYMTKILKEMGGELRGPKPVPGSLNTNQYMVELAFEMEAIKYGKDMPNDLGLRLAKPVVHRQTDELYRFVETLRDVRVTILAPSRSTFTANIAQYTENWGMDLTYVATEDMDVIPGILSQLDENMPGYQAHGRLQILRNVIIINDDFGMLDVVINHRIENLIVGTLVIYFTSPQNHARMNEYAETTAEGHGELMPEVYVVTKPAGPCKLLQVLKWIMSDRPGEPHMDDPATDLKRRRRGGNLVVEGARSTRAPRIRGRRGESQPAVQQSPNLGASIPSMLPPADYTLSISSKRASRGGASNVISPTRSSYPDHFGSATSQSAGSTSSSNHSGHDPNSATSSGDKPSADKTTRISTPAQSPTKRPSAIMSVSTHDDEDDDRAPSNPRQRQTPAPVPHSHTTNSSLPPPTSSTPASISALLFSRIKVLIAEDNPINQTILSTFLRKRGISAAVAGNGQEAVRKFQQGVFHIILMDIIMPVMDGIQATRLIRSIERDRAVQANMYLQNGGSHDEKSNNLINTPDVVIVALTASSLPADRDAALQAGCNDYLIKPASLVWLERKILEWGAMQALIDYDTLLSYTPTVPPTSALPPQSAPFASSSTSSGLANAIAKQKMKKRQTSIHNYNRSPPSPTLNSSIDSSTAATTNSSMSTNSSTSAGSDMVLNGILSTPPSSHTTTSLDLPAKQDHNIRPRSVASAPGLLELPSPQFETVNHNHDHNLSPTINSGDSRHRHLTAPPLESDTSSKPEPNGSNGSTGAVLNGEVKHASIPQTTSSVPLGVEEDHTKNPFLGELLGEQTVQSPDPVVNL
ncbi:hypothetical protein PhCBS80983_g01022 [Powellomyces hirtus]|uniref:Response regulatory domain-containing protein n=1 Tax=Powellomyces hirtus TaxID=109895 RepID=A0A507ECI2_9FUNG|nr:hypothetical protein PhCBS80983_g01022 [Powellomyces hirtus]